MSRYSGNGDRCPTCGITYGRFRTGLSYQAVHDMLKDNSEDPEDWRYKRRGTVLGHWHQIKKEWWDRHLYECEQQARYEQKKEEMPKEAKSYKLMGCEFKLIDHNTYEFNKHLLIYFEQGGDEFRALLEVDGEDIIEGLYRKTRGEALRALEQDLKRLSPLFEKK